MSLSPFDDYLSSAAPRLKIELGRIRSVVEQVVPTATQGSSYGMTAFLLNGKPVLSAMARKNYLSLYPFSGKVIDKLRDQLDGFEITKGSIHVAEARPLPDSLLKLILEARVQEIEETAIRY